MALSLTYNFVRYSYDDNRTPDKIDTLHDHILQNSNLIWLVQTSPDVDRTLNDRTGASADDSGTPTCPHGTAELDLLTTMELNALNSTGTSAQAESTTVSGPNTKRARTQDSGTADGS